jgi:hypothetical protein
MAQSGYRPEHYLADEWHHPHRISELNYSFKPQLANPRTALRVCLLGLSRSRLPKLPPTAELGGSKILALLLGCTNRSANRRMPINPDFAALVDRLN